jgi:hypothetical protein
LVAAVHHAQPPSIWLSLKFSRQEEMLFATEYTEVSEARVKVDYPQISQMGAD